MAQKRWVDWGAPVAVPAVGVAVTPEAAVEDLGRAPWAAAGLALGGPCQGLLLSRTIRRSQSRMSGPMYVANLIEHQLAAKE